MFSAQTSRSSGSGGNQRRAALGPALYAARRWLPPEPLDLDVWAENIPYNETRAYVQRVAWHTLVFDWLEQRKPRDVSNWLRSVKPLEATAARAN